jgi:16S rRNA (guanine966-N2)-methyltransferase
LRVVSGIYRGRNIQPPKNFRARPTTDFAKVGLFNILANYFDFSSVRVLDLFSGTGSISFEFASRGCRNIELVENDHIHMAFIKKVIRDWKISGIHTSETSVFNYIKLPRVPFDIIFCDPPYEMEGIEQIPLNILNKGLLTGEGWLIMEHSGKFKFDMIEGFREVRNYGSVHFSFFEKKSASDSV